MASEAAKTEDAAPQSIGRRIAHYQLVSRVGEGGMGVVYRALDTKLRRDVALKVLHPKVADDEDRRKRFIREGRLVAHLTHPNIATVYDVGESDGRVFIAMEMVEGEPLTAMIRPGRHVSSIEALRVMHEVVRGLQKAHEIGVIHRDLKPDNIMVGEDGIVKILDFGVAKRLESFKLDFTDIKTQHGSLVGTPAYMSPEQAAGKSVDARSDIFSVGVVLHELLTGKRPFDGETWQETIISINRDDPAPITSFRSDVPKVLDDIVDGCMAKNPDARYESCRELLDDLEAALVGLTTNTFPPGTGTTGIIARASVTSAPPPASQPPGSGPLGAGPTPASQPAPGSAPTSTDIIEEATAPEARVSNPTVGPMAQSIREEPPATAPRKTGIILAAALALAAAVVAVTLGMGDDPAPAAPPPAEEGALADEPAAKAPEGEPATEGEADASDEPVADEPASESSATPSVTASATATAETTAKPPPKAGPTPRRTPPPKPAAPPKPTTKPKNPVLGF